MSLTNSGTMNSPHPAMTPASAQTVPAFSRAGSIGTLPWLGHLARAAAAGLREVFAFVHIAANLRDELRRMADECEATRPQQARQLREVANSTHWGE